MKLVHSGRQTAHRLIIFRRNVYASHFIYCTPGHLILGVLVKFSGVQYARTPVTGNPVRRGNAHARLRPSVCLFYLGSNSIRL